jgi:predicted  nucleic acid-binding Zn-ribbon protein
MKTTTDSNPDTLEAARIEKLRSQLSTDIETIQQKEASLREYEQRLRLLVEQANQSHPPQGVNQYLAGTSPAQQVQADRSALDSEWEKYQRANALLEAARRSLTDDRLALKDREEKVMIREQEVARREAWVTAREQQLAKAVADAAAAAAVKPKRSITAAPFIAARNLLAGRSMSDSGNANSGSNPNPN